MNALALLIALAVDRWWGEPPVRLHPVVWMGNYLGWAGKHLQRATVQHITNSPDYKAFWMGALAWFAGAAMVLIVAYALQEAVLVATAPLIPWLATLLGALLLGLLLKPLLAWSMLQSEVLAVEKALSPEQGGSLANGRERLAWLVSRDVSQLSEAQVRESAIESLAENLNDSVVAPIFWFVLLGLPGAALYRFANTADAMWGYRGVYKGQNWEWAGKWAARADDFLSWLPARITGVLLVWVGGAGLGVLRAEAMRTPSPNSGWPMAAMALSLDVCLHKPGVYALHASGREPTVADTPQAIRYASKALLALVVIVLAATVYIAFSGQSW
jgi:adenosylcobinamide-phosphate synthase